MPSILDSIQQQVASTAVQQITQRLGLDPVIAQQAVSVAIPAITAAIAAHARSGSAAAIHQAATSQVSNAATSPSLPQVLGDQHPVAAQRVSDVTGVSSADANEILKAVAPAVLRGIGQHVQENGVTSGQLASVLTAAASDAQQRSQNSKSGDAARA